VSSRFTFTRDGFTFTRDERGRLFATPIAGPLKYESYLECTNIPIALRPALEGEPKPHVGGLLWGPTGGGKSWMGLQETVLTGLRSGAVSKFISIPRYIGELRDTYALELSPRDEQVRLLRNAAVARYAVLDDLGAEKLTDRANEQLYILIDDRAAKGLPTLVTSNLSIQAIAAVHGDRIASRILGFSVVRPRKIEERDRRFHSPTENDPTRPKKGSAFLWIAPRPGVEETTSVSQGELLSDLEPGRPRNGGAA
jgi:hypothetical protein